MEDINDDNEILVWEFGIWQSCLIGGSVFGIFHRNDILPTFMEIPRQELMFQSNRRLAPGIRHADVESHQADKPIRLQPDRIAWKEFHLGIKGRL